MKVIIRIRPTFALIEFTHGHQFFQNKVRFGAYYSRKHPIYTIVKSFAYLFDLISFYLKSETVFLLLSQYYFSRLVKMNDLLLYLEIFYPRLSFNP